MNRYHALSALLGVAYTFSFAPFSLWSVGLVALAGLFLLFQRSETAKSAVGYGVLFGVFHYVTSLHWLVSSFYMTIKNWPLAIAGGGLAVVFIALFLSLFIGGIGYIVQKISSNYKAYLPLVFTGMWLVAEIIRSALVPTFAWNLAGHSLAYVDEILQLASIGGVYILSALFVLTASALVCSKRWAFSAIVICAVCYGFGYDRLSKHEVLNITEQAEGKTHIRLVSGNINQIDKWDPTKKKAAINTYIEESNAGEGVPDVVIWPETSVAYFLNKHAELRRYLTDNLIAEALIVGAPYKSKEGLYYNSLYALGGKGEIRYRYDKRALVPFGEYFPLREYFPSFFERFLQGQGDYTPGPLVNTTLTVAGEEMAPLICGEVVLPRLRSYVSENVNYLINITNDAWFKGTIAPYQHFAFVKVQAVSLNKKIIRVSNYGHNAFVDNFGKILVITPPGSTKIIDVYL